MGIERESKCIPFRNNSAPKEMSSSCWESGNFAPCSTVWLLMLTLNAYAKVNIGLHVVERRPDGYHNIATVFAPVELFDVITIEPAPTITVHTRPSLGIAEHDNLAYRAAAMLQEVAAINDGAKITIRKHIPPGSGLGGGSSDAATVLRGLCQLWRITPDDSTLFSIAQQIGSDVPYFLNPRFAYAEGRGDILTVIPPLRQCPVLIVVPPIAISTAWAYAQIDLVASFPRQEALRSIIGLTNLSDEMLRTLCTNDFEEVVYPVYPILSEIKAALYAAGAHYASLTGTGSALFAFFDNINAALIAATRFPTYRTFVTHLLA